MDFKNHVASVFTSSSTHCYLNVKCAKKNYRFFGMSVFEILKHEVPFNDKSILFLVNVNSQYFLKNNVSYYIL